MPISKTRRWTDSLKIKRKKSKEVQVLDRGTEDSRDMTDEKQTAGDRGEEKA